MAERLKITQVKSAIGYRRDQGVTLKALGLGKMWRTVEKPDTPAVRGMINKVRHLVRVEPASAEAVSVPARPPEFTVLEQPVPEAEESPDGGKPPVDVEKEDSQA